MPLSGADFRSIETFVRGLINEVIGRRDQYFITSPVVKRDEKKKLVWIAELGHQPIPCVGFKRQVKYYDTDSTGSVKSRTAQVDIVVPSVGAVVLVVCERGSKSLPRCLGEIQGTNWMIVED